MSEKNKKRVLIIDQLNLFYRNYIVNPSLSVNGAPIGGLKGCFQSIQKISRESKPDLIIICWDGEGGSAKRKLMKKDYKAGRKPIRLNRDIRNMSEDQETENKIWQQTRLIEYYNQTPIIQFMFKNTEADDIIAYLTQIKELEDAEKLIISSDKDFFQLLDAKTVQYRPVQKEVLNQKIILEKFNVHPVNFAMARALEGDKSDNIEGVEGLGLKTIAKRFPFLREEKPATFIDMLSYCKKQLQETNVKAYQKVLDSEGLFKRNYHMMQLYSPSLGIEAKKTVRDTIKDPDMSFNKTGLIKMMMKDGFGEVNFIDLFQHFNRISIDNR